MIPPEQLPKDLKVKLDLNYEFLGQAMEALANPTRLKLLAFLTVPRYLEEIAGELKVTRQAARKHLDKLVAAGVLLRRPGQRETGPVTEYLLSPQAIFIIHDEFGKLGSLRPREKADVMVRTKTEPPRAAGGRRADGPGFFLVRGLNPGHYYALGATEGRKWVLGRDPRCHVVLEHDPYASNRHAELRWEGGRFLLADLASTNGTDHNFARLDRGATVPLRHGDVVGVGKTLLLFTDARTAPS